MLLPLKLDAIGRFIESKEGKVVRIAEIFRIIWFCFSVTETGGTINLTRVFTVLFEMCVFIFFTPFYSFFFFLAYSTFYIVGLILSMQIPFVGFQPIRTSEHMAAAGKKIESLLPKST